MNTRTIQGQDIKVGDCIDYDGGFTVTNLRPYLFVDKPARLAADPRGREMAIYDNYSIRIVT